MYKIYKIPVIGYLIRLIVALVKLPKNIQTIGLKIKNMQAEMAELTEYTRMLEEKLSELNRKIDDEHMKNEETRGHVFEDGFEQMLANGEKLERLNLQLSIHPTIWGDKSRLHISPLAAVFPCFFNTNSGEITVGDYTFAGSNVSILAGSHDMFLEGLSRRDAEMKQGCDITIGQGVWLASGCTILGPCSIGDNAVIAADAVVIPGTEIPANTVYAGIPARQVRRIEVESQMESRHVIDAVDRENGILFVDGWSEKRQIVYKKEIMQGHWMVKNLAYIYTNASKFKLLFHKEVEDPVKLIWCQGEEQREILLAENEMEQHFFLDVDGTTLNEVKIVGDEMKFGQVFVAVVENRIENKGVV